MLRCWEENPMSRPTFSQLVHKLEQLIENLSDQVKKFNLNCSLGFVLNYSQAIIESGSLALKQNIFISLRITKN